MSRMIALVGEKGAGMFALVDDEDYEAAAALRWSLIRPNLRCPHGIYCQAWVPGEGGTKRRLTLHRFLLEPGNGVMIDHINGDGLDCRRANLRLATHSQNQCNRRARNGAAHKGVHRKPSGRWAARIESGGRTDYLGTFDTPEAAAACYQEAAEVLHGPFSYGRPGASRPTPIRETADDNLDPRGPSSPV